MLVAVVVVGVAIAVGATSLVSVAAQSRTTSERARDRVLALAAAEVSVAEATARLASDPDYLRSAADGVDVGDPGLRGWVAGEDGSQRRHLVRTAADGMVEVIARGRAGAVERVVEVRLRPRTFADVHRFTDVEAFDPHVTPGATPTDCARHRWASPPRATSCPEARYGPSEVVGGRVHSNDVVVVAGTPRFRGRVSTAWLGSAGDPRSGTLWVAGDAAAAPEFRRGIHHDGLLPLPSVGAIETPPGGCDYHGPTLIRLNGTSMRVWSPGSAQPAPGAPATTAACGAGALGARVTVPLPASGVVRVHRRASGCTTHPLGLGSAEDFDGGYDCAAGDAFVWGTYDGRLTVIAADDAHLVWDVVAADDGPWSDDALGIIAGRGLVLRRPVTAPVRGSAPLGRNVAFAGPGIAPFGPFPLDAPNASAMTWESPRVEAHLMALGRSLRIQNPARGQRHTGVVRLRGSVAQRFRGPLELEVRSSSGSLIGVTGYPSDLAPRAAVTLVAPPAFPRLGDGSWVTISWRELPADGA